MSRPPGTWPTQRGPSITGAYKDNLADLIERLAAAGRDDPAIAARLGLTVSQVRRLRAEFTVPAGERRWLPARTCGTTTDTSHTAVDDPNGSEG